MSVFECKDYKDFLNKMIKENSSQVGYKSKLAKACNTPSSFISQVLKTHVELSSDHGIKLAYFWGLNDLERDYFLELIHLARASSHELKSYIKHRLQNIKDQAVDMAKRFQQPKVEETQGEWSYYSSWYMGALHMLLTIPGMNRVETISQRLNLSQPLVLSALNNLESLGLAKKSGAGWAVTKKSIHLAKKSPLSAWNHSIWRTKAIEGIPISQLQPGAKDRLHYSALHTLSVKDFEKLHLEILKFIESFRKTVEPSPEEMLACINLDWFEV